MMRALLLITMLVAAAAMLSGCGGGGSVSEPEPPGAPGPVETLEVGPMLVRPASTAGFRVVGLGGGALTSLTALYGAQIDYLAAQAMLDRIVFSSNRSGTVDLWTCNLDGSGLVRLTSSAASDSRPQWSPDGTKIVFDRAWPGQDREICVINADGSSPRALTNNAVDDVHGTWSPEGRRVAWAGIVGGKFDIWTMFEDGSAKTNLTADPSEDTAPHWSAGGDKPIAFASNRSGDMEIYKMRETGDGLEVLTSVFGADNPAWAPNASQIAFEADYNATPQIWIMDNSGYSRRVFSASLNPVLGPAWSSDGRYIACTSVGPPAVDIRLQETGPPYRFYDVVTHSAIDESPALGSPSVQVERVLIGPNGSDWGGGNPVWTNAMAGIVAFDPSGYRSFVRIGVDPQYAASIRVTPLADPGTSVIGVAVEATRIANLRQDEGRLRPASKWDFAASSAGAIAIYLNSHSGRIAAVLVTRDSVYPTMTPQSVAGDRLTVRGDFAAVYDDAGNCVARDVASATIDAAAGVVSGG